MTFTSRGKLLDERDEPQPRHKPRSLPQIPTLDAKNTARSLQGSAKLHLVEAGHKNLKVDHKMS